MVHALKRAVAARFTEQQLSAQSLHSIG